jgi:hypothetical protein
MSIKYDIIKGGDTVKNIKKKISKYFYAYEAVRQLKDNCIAKIEFDDLNVLRGFQSQINCNMKYRGRYATKSENLTLYVWTRY